MLIEKEILTLQEYRKEQQKETSKLDHFAHSLQYLNDQLQAKGEILPFVVTKK